MVEYSLISISGSGNEKPLYLILQTVDIAFVCIRYICGFWVFLSKKKHQRLLINGHELTLFENSVAIEKPQEVMQFF